MKVFLSAILALFVAVPAASGQGILEDILNELQDANAKLTKVSSKVATSQDIAALTGAVDKQTQAIDALASAVASAKKGAVFIDLSNSPSLCSGTCDQDALQWCVSIGYTKAKLGNGGVYLANFACYD